MGKLINIEGKYKNTDAVSKVIKYVTRTRENEKRRNELITYGGIGVGNYASPKIMEQRFNIVQNLYGINYRKGRRVLHEVFSITDNEFGKLGYDMNIMDQIALEMCKEYFNEGFQVVYGIHWEEKKKLQIHFAENSVRYVTGKKIDTSINSNNRREQKFNKIMKRYYKSGKVSFDSTADTQQDSSRYYK